MALRAALRYSRRPGSGANSLRSPCTRLWARCASRYCSRATPQSIDYDRPAPQSAQTNPHRSAPIQKPLSDPKQPNWVFQLPFT